MRNINNFWNICIDFQDVFMFKTFFSLAHTYSNNRKRVFWLIKKKRLRYNILYRDLLLLYTMNLHKLPSFFLLISWNITIYLVSKAKRKWSIRCSGRTRVISHFASRYIFGTDTIALFHKITLRHRCLHCIVVHTQHTAKNEVYFPANYYYTISYFRFIFYKTLRQPHNI